MPHWRGLVKEHGLDWLCDRLAERGADPSDVRGAYNYDELLIRMLATRELLKHELSILSPHRRPPASDDIKANAKSSALGHLDQSLGWLEELAQTGLEQDRFVLVKTDITQHRDKLLARTEDDEDFRRCLLEIVDQLGTRISELDDELPPFEHWPNLAADDVPEGQDHTANRLIRTGGPHFDPDAHALAHDQLGTALGLMDFKTAAQMSGARFVILKGALARLERALGQFMLDLHCRDHGYTEVSPPLLVRDQALFGTGQLPKFQDDLFRTQETGHWLIPTAEVPLANMVADSILAVEDLPLRLAALTPCFRAEAGAAGKDTRGMIRQHQFWKVELVSVTTPEESPAEHERMTSCAEKVLELLGLPFRTMLLCRGDMGFAARKTYDLEVWLPGAKTYREISSCSDCGDFQARRMQARYRPVKGKKPRLVHTLNGSGVAVGRCLVAILENYQQSDGSITIPEVLRPYMNNQSVITKETR